MGFTNSVQPYCRFAIIAMQMMPRNSCIQRYDAGRVVILFNVPASASVSIVPPKTLQAVTPPAGLGNASGYRDSPSLGQPFVVIGTRSVKGILGAPGH